MYYNYQPNQYAGGGLYPPQIGLKGRPVSSLEEARAANIDFDGSLFLFPDVANKKIYSKQINLDGTLAMKVYTLVESPDPAPAYVTKEEFDSAIKNLELSFAERKEKSENNAESISSQPITKPSIPINF